MISKCGNPACAIPLDYRQGRFFRFRKNHLAGAEPVNAHSVQHFWLCGPCSAIYTLECQRDVGVVIKLHIERLRKAGIVRLISAA